MKNGVTYKNENVYVLQESLKQSLKHFPLNISKRTR